MQFLTTLYQTYKKKGVKATIRFLRATFFSKKTKPIEDIKLYRHYLKGKRGIEVGGPSPIFSREIPIYQIISSLDGCNFSRQTIWEGNIEEGNNYNYFRNKKGFQFICEASDLRGVGSAEYDFLIASHCLEHCANTFKTMTEWTRVVKKGGLILLVLPDSRYTFDRGREVTSFEHLEDDYKRRVDETDLTHLDEILRKHDLSMDLPAGSAEQFKTRSKDNFNNRCLHHHVFDFGLLQKLYAAFDIKVVNTAFAPPFHQIILGIKQ